MPDRDLLPKERLSLRRWRFGMYLAPFYASIAAWIWTPASIEGASGILITRSWATIVFLATIVCMVGVVKDKYRVEWAAVWFAAIGVGGYVGTVLYLAINMPTRQTQAAICATVILALGYRGTELKYHAAKLKRREAALHEFRLKKAQEQAEAEADG